MSFDANPPEASPVRVRRTVIEEVTLRRRRNFVPLLLLPIVAVGAGVVGATGTRGLHNQLKSDTLSELSPELRAVVKRSVTIGGAGTRLVLRGTVESQAQRTAIARAAARARVLSQGDIVNEIVVKPAAAAVTTMAAKPAPATSVPATSVPPSTTTVVSALPGVPSTTLASDAPGVSAGPSGPAKATVGTPAYTG